MNFCRELSSSHHSKTLVVSILLDYVIVGTKIRLLVMFPTSWFLPVFDNRNKGRTDTFRIDLVYEITDSNHDNHNVESAAPHIIET